MNSGMSSYPDDQENWQYTSSSALKTTSIARVFVKPVAQLVKCACPAGIGGTARTAQCNRDLPAPRGRHINKLKQINQRPLARRGGPSAAMPYSTNDLEPRRRHVHLLRLWRAL